MAIISFNNFNFQYDAQAEPTLRDITFDISEGETVLITGASGSGKSTVGSCINGLIPHAYHGACTGTVTVNGQVPADAGIFELSHTVGTVLQDQDGQFIGLTAGEDIAFALENACTPQDTMFETVGRVADLVDIPRDHLALAPHELSGGQKQRISLAGVMVDEVKVLLFDEPLANLDPAAGLNTIELIERVQRETGAAVIIIEHRLEDVLWGRVDRIILMEDGAILADMPPAQLLSTSLLQEHGIREPLYISALRYAGVDISPDIVPESIQNLKLDDAARGQVVTWYDDFPSQNVPDSSQSPLLAVSHLNFGYEPDREILHDISFSIGDGEMLAIVGENGAGKSTLAKVICGFEQAESGTISFAGRDITSDTIKERASVVGYVMQNPNQMISKPLIWDEIEMALLHDDTLDEATRTERVNEALKICGLYEMRHWPISALSYGQKKRVTIASVLVQRPRLILLDEPTAGQDLYHYTEIMEFLRSLNEQGFAIALITHDMHLMLEYTPRALVFEQGTLIADDTPARILSDPALVARASLRQTSLYALGRMCGIEDAPGFVDRFIAQESASRDSLRNFKKSATKSSCEATDYE